MQTPKTFFIIERVENEAIINHRLAEAREKNVCPVQVRVSDGFVVVLMQDLSEVDSCNCPACSGADIASMFGFPEQPKDDEGDVN